MSDSVSRRNLAKGAAWSVPAVALSAAVPAVAASVECLEGVATGTTTSYTWGTLSSSVTTTATTTQTLTLTGYVRAALPADAVITAMSLTFYVQQRVASATNADGSKGTQGPGAYVPTDSHAKASNAAAPQTGAADSANPWLQGSSSGKVSNAGTSRTFANSKSTVASSWQYTFTADPSVANAALVTQSNGCKTLYTNADGSLASSYASTPTYTVTYSNVTEVKDATPEKSVLIDRVASITYTSGGQSYTQTTSTKQNTGTCGTQC